MTAIELDVWADVVCPWCYIAKHRLERAIAQCERPSEVTVRYRAYELDPGRAVGAGGGIVADLAKRYGRGEDEARRMAEYAAHAGRPDGVRIDVDRQVLANTFDAHRLVALGLDQGGPALQGAVVERLFAAHFQEGKVLDDHEVLQRLGAEAGLDEGHVATALASDEYAEQVRADQEAARALGVTGVPFVVANNAIAMAGAQSEEAFGDLLREALKQAGATADPA